MALGLDGTFLATAKSPTSLLFAHMKRELRLYHESRGDRAPGLGWERSVERPSHRVLENPDQEFQNCMRLTRYRDGPSGETSIS